MEEKKQITRIERATGRTHEVSVINYRGKASRRSFSIRDARECEEILDGLFSLIQHNFGTGRGTHYLSVKDIKTGKVRSMTLRGIKKMTTAEVIELIKTGISKK